MIRFVKSFSRLVFVCISCAIVAVSVISPYYGIPLTALFVCGLLWQSYHSKTTLNVHFQRLHDCPKLVNDTAVLLLQEWPSPEGNHGEPERNFVRTASLYESSDKFPCHLVAYTTDNEVLAHVTLSISNNSNSRSYSKYVKMLQHGVPLAAVKNSAKLAGLDTDFLDSPGILEHTFDSTQDSSGYEGYVSSLLVKPSYRGFGLGKAMCGYAVLMAKELKIAKVVFGCSDKVLPFYQKMGVCRDIASKRDDIPTVKLGNNMYLDLGDDVIERAQSVMSKYTVMY